MSGLEMNVCDAKDRFDDVVVGSSPLMCLTSALMGQFRLI